jgi:exonuclease SbcD
VLGPDALGIPASVACFPFLREGRVVDFMRDTGEWYGAYAERVAAIAAHYNAALVEASRRGEVPVLVAHFMVSGVRVSHSERELHIGDAYAATAQAIPPGPQYVALGHIHAPQDVPGAPVPARYAGSLLPLDFGEAGEVKRVVLVDVEPGRLATVTSVPLTAGRPLERVTGTWDEIEARADGLRERYLDLTVDVGGVDPELGRRAADAFPFVVNVRARRPATEAVTRRRGAERPRDDELYVEYVRRTTGAEAPQDLLQLFREVLEEAADASA